MSIPAKFKKFLSEGKFSLRQELPDQLWIPSGSLTLDAILGGGYPRGKVVEIFGPPSSGKSLLSLVAEANATKQGLYVLHCDQEGNHSTKQLNQRRLDFGVDMDYVLTKDPCPLEEVIDDTVKIMREAGSDIALMIVDAIGAFASEKTLKKTAEEKTIAEEAKLIKKWLNQLLAVNRNTCIMLLNHTIANITNYGGGRTTPGGDAPKFHASIRLDVKGECNIDPETEKPISHTMKVHTKKNKVSAPLKTAEIIFDYSTFAFSKEWETINVGIQTGVIQKKPPMYHFEIDGQEYKVKGKNNFKEWLAENPEHFNSLQNKIFKLNT